MVWHTFKSYATTLHILISRELNHRHICAKGQVGFRGEYQTMDHIFSLWSITKELQNRSLKVYRCFVYFPKAIDFVPRTALF